MASLNHLHTYRRSKDNIDIYRCTDPHCTHYAKRDAILGKEIRCAKCHAPTLALQMQLKSGQNRPGRKDLTCLEHSSSPRATEAAAVSSVLDDLFKDVAS